MRKKNHSITKDLNSSIPFFLKELTIQLEIKRFFHDQLTVHLLKKLSYSKLSNSAFSLSHTFEYIYCDSIFLTQ